MRRSCAGSVRAALLRAALMSRSDGGVRGSLLARALMYAPPFVAERRGVRGSPPARALMYAPPSCRGPHVRAALLCTRRPLSRSDGGHPVSVQDYAQRLRVLRQYVAERRGTRERPRLCTSPPQVAERLVVRRSPSGRESKITYSALMYCDFMSRSEGARRERPRLRIAASCRGATGGPGVSPGTAWESKITYCARRGVGGIRHQRVRSCSPILRTQQLYLHVYTKTQLQPSSYTPSIRTTPGECLYYATVILHTTSTSPSQWRWSMGHVRIELPQPAAVRILEAMSSDSPKYMSLLRPAAVRVLEAVSSDSPKYAKI